LTAGAYGTFPRTDPNTHIFRAFKHSHNA